MRSLLRDATPLRDELENNIEWPRPFPIPDLSWTVRSGADNERAQCRRRSCIVNADEVDSVSYDG